MEKKTNFQKVLSLLEVKEPHLSLIVLECYDFILFSFYFFFKNSWYFWIFVKKSWHLYRFISTFGFISKKEKRFWMQRFHTLCTSLKSISTYRCWRNNFKTSTIHYFCIGYPSHCCILQLVHAFEPPLTSQQGNTY